MLLFFDKRVSLTFNYGVGFSNTFTLSVLFSKAAFISQTSAAVIIGCPKLLMACIAQIKLFGLGHDGGAFPTNVYSFGSQGFPGGNAGVN
ncbi:hypothetical protein [Sphingobacterium sp. MYb388]|uniref:hypothetical protein n=1 Tax=Sphingobacterium sp. MYb388 TaxID=2745437 RepID=UPI003099848D